MRARQARKAERRAHAAERTPEDWARCLRLAARLPGESFANILLIPARRPGATLLRGYDAWRAMGRQVSRQEKGIMIFSAARQPRPEHQDPRPGQAPAEPVPSWRDAERVAYLWDLSQTSGRAVTESAAIPSPPGQAPPGLWDALCWMARREGFAVEREYGCPDNGVTMWAVRRIRVLPGLDDQQAAWALAHQLGHVLLHEPVDSLPGTTTSGCTGVRKAEADSVALERGAVFEQGHRRRPERVYRAGASGQGSRFRCSRPLHAASCDRSASAGRCPRDRPLSCHRAHAEECRRRLCPWLSGSDR